MHDFRRRQLEEAWRIVDEGVDQGAFAGVVALVARDGAVELNRALGWAVCEPAAIPMADETVFDLASLTKVVGTLPSILKLAGAGEISLDLPAGRVLPALGAAGAWGELTIRHLLSHTAGLPAWLPLYLDVVGPEAYVAAIARSDLASPPGQQVIYSDLGFILLGEIVRRVSGRDVAQFATEEIFTPLGMEDTMYRPSSALCLRIAATEHGNLTEIGMCGNRAASFARWRRGMIWGEVHDGNAYYGLHGVAGHAGLFGTAPDLARYGQMWLQGGAWDGRQVLPEALVAEATRPQAPGRGLGWVLPPPDLPDQEPFPGRGLSPTAFGHTGFTGTSLWIDPERRLVVVLLTNRVHPALRTAIAEVRPAFHARVAAAYPLRST